MGLNINIVLNAPDLPNTGVWFANSAAFVNYLNNLPATGVVDPAQVNTYTPVAYDETIVPAAVNIDGNDYVLITLAMFISLRNKLEALDTSYQNLRTGMINAGIIE